MDRDPTPSEKIPTREEIVSALQKFTEQGITHPDDLDGNDPDVIEVERMLDAWHAESLRRAKEKDDIAEMLLWGVDRSMIYIDAGFHDPEYLDEVAHDWLLNELGEAEKQGLDAIIAKIQAKRAEIDVLIGRGTQ